MHVSEIKANLNKVVYYKDFYSITDWTPFYLNGCMVRKDSRGMLYYEAELMDMNKRCVILAKLDKVSLTK